MRLRCPNGCAGTRSRKTRRLRQCPTCGTKRQPRVKKSQPIASDSWLPLAVPVRVPEKPVVPVRDATNLRANPQHDSAVKR